MDGFFRKLFDASDFPPHWLCGNWDSSLGWLHIGSDLAIWGACAAIPAILAWFLLRRSGLPFSRIIRRNEHLRRESKRVEDASRFKSEFLANMSHELRTPLTAILGYADVLSEQPSSADSSEAISAIRRSGNHLLEIISDVLDLSKIETGKLEVERIPCSPISILADVASMTRVRAQAKGLALAVEYDGPIPETIETDPTRLRQIVLNLIGNAIKFTDRGSVRIVARLLAADSRAPQLEVEVIDTGVGVPAEQLDRLFKPFSQTDASMTRRFGGTGLGLSLCKYLAEALGGQIGVESPVDQGSTFRFTVATGSLRHVRLLHDVSEAAQPCREPTAAAPPSKPPLDCRVLLAEDGLDNQRLISLILKNAGAKVVVAENGRLALEAVLGDPSRPFDVVLMDMQMPEMDGYTATRRLREAGHRGPIIAVTAHAMKDDRQKCIAAGCDDYLAKPIDRDMLLALVATYAGQQRKGIGSRESAAWPRRLTRL